MTIHVLPATPETVRVGLIDQAHPCVLAIEPGDEVVIETWNHWADAVTPETTLADVIRYRTVEYPDRGPHSVTGPIEVAGARAGDVLRVDVLEVIPARTATTSTCRAPSAWVSCPTTSPTAPSVTSSSTWRP